MWQSRHNLLLLFSFKRVKHPEWRGIFSSPQYGGQVQPLHVGVWHQERRYPVAETVNKLHKTIKSKDLFIIQQRPHRNHAIDAIN